MLVGQHRVAAHDRAAYVAARGQQVANGRHDQRAHRQPRTVAVDPDDAGLADLEAQRARRVLEELRRRIGEPTRSQEELDYLERLLRD